MALRGSFSAVQPELTNDLLAAYVKRQRELKTFSGFDAADINRLLDLAMWGLATTVMLSGFVISESVLPAIGLQIDQTTMWMRVHSLASALLLFVLAFHLLSHGGWILTQTKALLRRGR